MRCFTLIKVLNRGYPISTRQVSLLVVLLTHIGCLAHHIYNLPMGFRLPYNHDSHSVNNVNVNARSFHIERFIVILIDNTSTKRTWHIVLWACTLEEADTDLSVVKLLSKYRYCSKAPTSKSSTNAGYLSSNFCSLLAFGMKYTIRNSYFVTRRTMQLIIKLSSMRTKSWRHAKNPDTL